MRANKETPEEETKKPQPKNTQQTPELVNIIARFQALHRKKFGEDITYETAGLQLQELAGLVRLTSPKGNEVRNA